MPARALRAPAAKGPLSAFRAPARRLPARPSWKLVGLAGVAGVAATGVVVARRRRAHVELPPDELRARLHSRLGEVAGGQTGSPPDAAEVVQRDLDTGL